MLSTLSRTLSSCRKIASYAHGSSSTPLLYETIGERFRSSTEAVPDKELYVFDHQGIRKTYAQAYADARRLACALLELGLHQGDRIGIWGPNYYEWVTCQMATAIAGFVQVNVNPSYHADELKYALEKVGVRVLITPEHHKHSNYYKTLTEVVRNIATSKPGCGYVRSRSLPELQHIVLFGSEQKRKGCWRYEDLMDGVGSTSEKRLAELEGRVRVDDPVNIQYTSGTTGHPKGATLTHHSLLNNAYAQGKCNGYDKGDHRLCIPPPLYHCFGSVVGVLNAVAHKQTTVFPDAGFNSYKTLEVAARERCTSLFGTPTMFIDILSHLPTAIEKKWDLSALRGGYITGAPCPEALCNRLVQSLGMVDLTVLYGSTELSPVATSSKLDQPPQQRIKNVGYAVDHVELVVVDDDGVVVPRGTKGQLLARGYNVMQGYYNDEARTKKEISADRWYHTGDTAMMAEDGAVSIVGRSKDMIIRGGENIYPVEIEQFLFKIPGVADAQVFGVPDERFGEAVCAWIRVREGVTDLTAEKIQEECKGNFAHFKVPKYIIFKKESEFPMTATGKSRKVEMRQISKKELGLDQVKSHFDEELDE